jgi:hypothetical protein
MSTSRLALLAVLGVALGVASFPLRAGAQSSLGGQRAGTSSGTFLRIGVGARAVGMGETFVAIANDPSAIYWNPAGLASLQRREFSASHTAWPAEVNFEHLTFVLPSQRMGGSFAFQVGILAASMDETTELQPYGTGRTFSYSDLVIGAAYARRWTDKLLVGVGGKYLYEDLGSQVGGPTMGAVLFDVGSIFYLGLGSVRIATSLTNFGPALKPSGQWESPNTGEMREYDGFDPPLMFRYGLALEPIENANQRLTTSFEVNQPADNEQQMKAGLEWSWQRTFALRTGYNFRANELKFSGGAGFTGRARDMRGNVDYAFTDGGFLGLIHRVTLGVQF